MPTPEPPRIGLLAGEPSGDRLGASLIRAIRERSPGALCVGVGGPAMRAAGLDCLLPTETLTMNGFAEPLRRLPELLRLRRRLRDQLLGRGLDVFVGIDFNVFNLSLEKALKRRGLATVHYVSPSVYAWRRGRLKHFHESVDRMLALYPFEPPLYADAGVDAVFVGHPLADEIDEVIDPGPARSALGIAPDASLVLAVMPGSRRSELEALAPDFLRAAARVARLRPGTRVLVPVLDRETAERMERLAADLGVEVRVLVDDTRRALAAADLVLVKSGTGTLEAMLTGRPMVVAYRVGPWTWRLLRRLVHSPRIALPNLLAGGSLVPELLQDAATPEALAEALLGELAEGPQRRDRFRALAADLRRGAADRAAEAVLELASRREETGT
jgi:lipid-A-disaccharide synthase